MSAITNVLLYRDSSSSLEATMKLSEQNSACSLIEELLDTPGGNASIFERTLLEGIVVIWKIPREKFQK